MKKTTINQYILFNNELVKVGEIVANINIRSLTKGQTKKFNRQ